MTAERVRVGIEIPEKIEAGAVVDGIKTADGRTGCIAVQSANYGFDFLEGHNKAALEELIGGEFNPHVTRGEEELKKHATHYKHGDQIILFNGDWIKAT